MLNVQTRATLEQKMMPIKNEQFRTIEKKHDQISVKNYTQQGNTTQVFGYLMFITLGL